MTDKKQRAFVVRGQYRQGSTRQKFSKTVLAYSEQNAMERVMTLLGSQNRLSRRHILIDEVKTA